MTSGKILLLGTNLGDREKNLEDCRRRLEQRVGKIVRASSVYETAAWGKTDQPAFLNQVIIIETDLAPMDLLQAINAIEKDMGRVRMEKWGERLIDIDILYYDSLVLNEPELLIPHPEIANRRFTLVPLAEVMEDLVDPVLRRPIKELLKSCDDACQVQLFRAFIPE